MPHCTDPLLLMMSNRTWNGQSKVARIPFGSFQSIYNSWCKPMVEKSRAVASRNRSQSTVNIAKWASAFCLGSELPATISVSSLPYFFIAESRRTLCYQCGGVSARSRPLGHPYPGMPYDNLLRSELRFKLLDNYYTMTKGKSSEDKWKMFPFDNFPSFPYRCSSFNAITPAPYAPAQELMMANLQSSQISY